MTINLIRDISTERNKGQEESFELTYNISLFFSSNKIISKIDGWKKSNIKKLIKNIDEVPDMDIYFSKWNENIDIILLNSRVKLFSEKELSSYEKEIILSKKIKSISKLIFSKKDDKNFKYNMILFIISVTNNNNNIIMFSNMVLNEAVLTYDLLLEILVSKYILEVENV